MAAAKSEIEVKVTPDVTRLHELMVIIETHVSALRIDLERYMHEGGA